MAKNLLAFFEKVVPAAPDGAAPNGSTALMDRDPPDKRLPGGRDKSLPGAQSSEEDQEPEFSPPAEDDEPTLRYGDKSPDGWVEYAQELLMMWFDPKPMLTKTGKFDKATLKAVMQFQKDQKLRVDGVIGDQTWAALRMAKPEKPGTDGRKPHTFVEKGAKARWFLEEMGCFYYAGSDLVKLFLISVGDEPIEGKKAQVFVTPPGGKRKGTTVTIPKSGDKAPTGEGDMHVLKLESFKKNFPSVPPDQPMKDYLVEAYFDKELGGDSWSGPIDEGDSGSKSESGAAEPADDKAAADDTAANDRVEGDGRATGDKQLPGEVQPPEKKAASALKSIKIEPESFELAVRTQQQLRATGVYADGTTRDLTTSVDWWCNDLDAISVDKNGLATAQSKEGSAEIAATDGESGVTGSAKVTIKSGSGKPDPASGAVVLQSIKIDPESVELAVGAQHVFRATGVYADGSTRDLTTTVDWWCNDLEAVSIEKNGLATAQSKLGSAEIAATDGASGVTGSAKVTIKPGAAAPAAGPALQSIRVKPASVALDKGETQEFRATGVYADGTENDLILDVVWKSSNPDMVTIDADGLATAQKKKGTAQITATDKSGKVTGSVTVTVQGKGIFKGKFSRGLTADEISDAKSVYQDSIDYSKVKVVSGGLGSVGSSRTIGNTIAMTPKEFEPNSTELTGDGRKTLIHELGHVWQFQHGGAAYIPNALGAQLKSTIKTGDRNDAYVWRRAHKDGLPWEKWNAEQQASAMEDYHQAKKRIAAGDPKPDDAPCSDEETVKILEPYVGKVRDGKGAPGQRK